MKKLIRNIEFVLLAGFIFISSFAIENVAFAGDYSRTENIVRTRSASNYAYTWFGVDYCDDVEETAYFSAETTAYQACEDKGGYASSASKLNGNCRKGFDYGTTCFCQVSVKVKCEINN